MDKVLLPKSTGSLDHETILIGAVNRIHIQNLFRKLQYQFLCDIKWGLNFLEVRVLVDVQDEWLLSLKTWTFHHINTFVFITSIENVESPAVIPNFFCRKLKIFVMFWWFVCVLHILKLCPWSRCPYKFPCTSLTTLSFVGIPGSTGYPKSCGGFSLALHGLRNTKFTGLVFAGTIVGLRLLRIILMKASLSSKMYHWDLPWEECVLVGTWSTFDNCSASRFLFLVGVLVWCLLMEWSLVVHKCPWASLHCLAVSIVEGNASITTSQVSRVCILSVHNPASNEINDFRLCRTVGHWCLLLAHPTDGDKCSTSEDT